MFLTEVVNQRSSNSEISISHFVYQPVGSVVIVLCDHFGEHWKNFGFIVSRRGIFTVFVNQIFIDGTHNKCFDHMCRFYGLICIDSAVVFSIQSHSCYSPGFICFFSIIQICFFQRICKLGKMFAFTCLFRCNGTEIFINTISDSLCHQFMMRGIGNIKIIILIAHKSHFQNCYRDGTPVGSGHIIRRDHALVAKTGGSTVVLDDAAGKSLAFLNDVLVKILVGSSW